MSIAINNNLYKIPSKIAPVNAGAAVISREQERGRNETAKATVENQQIVSQAVILQTSISPKGGKSYVSGGTTSTVNKSLNDDEKKDFFLTNYNDVIAQNFGLILDVRV